MTPHMRTDTFYSAKDSETAAASVVGVLFCSLVRTFKVGAFECFSA